MPNPYAAKERIIRERRMIKATRENMMGASGKLGMIAKWLGHKIIRQGSGLFDETFLDDPFLEEAEELPMATDTNVTEEGFAFDGLSRGLHFEIRYLHSNTELTAYYKGYLVYKEVAGDLYAYAPFPEWEDDIVNILYEEAVAVADVKKEEFNEEKEAAMIKLGRVYLNKLRDRWGI